METKTGGKAWRILLAVLAVTLVAGMAASCVLSAAALSRMEGQEVQIARLSETLTNMINEELGRVTQEDDVKVAGEYMILSTRPISDAYRSGDDSALDERQKETLKMASDILDEIIRDGMSPYEQEVAVYDWMCANLSHQEGVTVAIPTTGEYCSQPYGVLKYHNAVCVGYATTFRLFMQMLDIECMVVHNSYHSWNLVRLDGEWYHTDIYSDVGRGDYENFNLTDEMCAMSHDWDTSFFPAATGLTYCYAYRNAVPLEDIYQLPQLVRSAAEQGQTVFLYYLLSDKAEHSIAVLDELLGRLDSAVMDYGVGQGMDLGMSRYIRALENEYLVSIGIHNYSENPDDSNPLSEEELQQIDQAMEDAFGSTFGSSDWDWNWEADE